MAYLHERPSVRCAKDPEANGADPTRDPLKPALYLATFLNAVLVPGCLVLVGWYITRRLRVLISGGSSIKPLRQSEESAEGIKVFLARAPAASDMSEPPDSEHVSGLAVSTYAAAYATCASELAASSTVKAGTGAMHNIARSMIVPNPAQLGR
ncbi:unnamed protein product [Symbiodinium natans]|uniref:Uncharacterized protein n=1 Tax=Symbiodinium natans TaxID=878477 RepID=A0A812SS81_9DINO|nr:unnamed protein product [Symbiodinium natans]